MRAGAVARGIVAALCSVLAALAVTPSRSVERLDSAAVLQKSEAARGRTIGTYTLIDSSGTPLSLRSYRGKPLVLSLIYTACSSVCPPTTQHLINAVTEARRLFGEDRFEVLTLGFDARNDTPARLRQFAATQGIKGGNWKLASADSATIEAVLRDLGFSYVAIAGGFDHVTQTTILDPEGKVYRQVYGDDFPLPMFIEPLRDVINGTNASFSFAGVVDRIRFICTAFDPATGRYRIDYGLVFGSVLAGISLAVFGLILVREGLRTSKARGRQLHVES